MYIIVYTYNYESLGTLVCIPCASLVTKTTKHMTVSRYPYPK